MKKKVLSLLFVFCALGLFKVSAQEYLPFISSPYSGVTAGKLNPASLAGSKYKFDVTLFGASGGVHNNLVKFKQNLIFSGIYFDLLDYQSKFLELEIPLGARSLFKDKLQNGTENKIEDDSEGKGYGGYFNAQYDVLNLMYSVNERFALAAGFGFRSQASAYGIPRNVAGRILNRFGGTSVSLDERLEFGPTSGAVALYNQIFVSGAYTFMERGNHILKGGLTGKFIFGGKSAFAFAKYYEGTISGTQPGISRIDGGEAGMATGKGTGFGADIGVEYEYRPDELAGNEISEYRLKAGVSLLDIGLFNSKNEERHDLGTGFGIPTGVEDLFRRYGTSGDNLGPYDMKLPMVFAASVDYRFASSPLFLNFTPYIALGQKSSNTAYKFHSFNLVPHAEWEKFGVSLPIQYDQYGKFTAGIGLRAFRYVWIGSNTILANIVSKSSYSADLHVMVKVPLYAKTDRDKDGISDKNDKCPDVPGLKKFQGCPDSDGDGVPDDQDTCPNEAGSAATNGCPDKDGDGIPDKEDRCPDQAGPRDLQGCPDKDGDGIPDLDDECSDAAGQKASKGCPDGDGDGVPDKDDKCPDVAGKVSLAGCPDKDNDGVADSDDECPDQAGPASNKGCPLAQDIQNVEFDIDKYNIKAQYQPELDKAVDILSKNPNATVVVAGHTDNTYTRAYNMQLSKRRAEAVKNYLVQKNIDAQRISIEYYGFDKPIADNNTVQGRSRNRRSEITIVIK